MTVIDFPLKQICSCGAAMRLATRAELNRDLRSSDPRLRQIAALTSQGVRRQEPPEGFAYLSTGTPASSWLYICDKCGGRCRCEREFEL